MNYSNKDLLQLYADAAFYDLEFSQREDEFDFFTRRCQEEGGKILEVTCGTGRILITLAKRGIQNLSGSDISPEMIAQARQKAAAPGPQTRQTE